MALIDISLPPSIAKALRLPARSPRRQQIRVLRKLLKKARFTEFGQKYRFDEILLSKHAGKKFQQLVPTYDYNKIYDAWWHKTLEGRPDICWPGKIKFFALSSGTSESASKYLPITNDLMRGNKIVMIKQLLSLRTYHDISVKSIGKGWLMLGGSTDLQKGPGYYAGDLSGITAKKVPFWFSPFYKPGKKIARTKDWNSKIEAIVEEAPNWDIGFVVGVPAWIQMCMEKIIERYNLKSIHDMWPNLAFFVHGGVSFEPYKKGFEKLVAKPLTYIETYLASEGFIAYQDRQFAKGMHLSLNDHIFFEFVPFNDKNFDSDGNIAEDAEALMIHEVEEGKDYAILISTTAGAWRYLIGDTVRFVDKEKCEIIITGRTKHFLSLVGEHLSVDNMNKAVQLVADEMNLCIPEYTVAGVPHGLFFAHQWYIACDDQLDAEIVRQKIDEKLKDLNDDYAVERNSALKDVYLKILPESSFMEFMRLKGKIGGQHKFPRVMKGKMYEDWVKFLETGTL
ncbi:GH3 auxin-responsive promoter family protein [Paraflavitalea sp. CAU 1676]|uniref:GH3 family domain-containing protein n=1 Tax=Paraflavitalea sp. CAU 1676 TaxID=3032598 RepID=UPI0023DB6F85|nr:GH3 auxin-responsive promoter family protein [Paraflavitalea sp. CAU 1676]MDF2191008.1 GH3 auxin-responsive promoter family protein [Paraflavitalea sp. CAU 1676]